MLARHANAKVTLTVYAGLTGDGREKAIAKLAEGGLARKLVYEGLSWRTVPTS